MRNFCAAFKNINLFFKCTTNKKKYHFSIHPNTGVFITVSQIHGTQQLIIISVVIQKEFLLCISRGSKNFKLFPRNLET